MLQGGPLAIRGPCIFVFANGPVGAIRRIPLPGIVGPVGLSKILGGPLAALDGSGDSSEELIQPRPLGFLERGRINRLEGAVLLLAYIGYMIWLGNYSLS